MQFFDKSSIYIVFRQFSDLFSTANKSGYIFKNCGGYRGSNCALNYHHYQKVSYPKKGGWGYTLIIVCHIHMYAATYNINSPNHLLCAHSFLRTLHMYINSNFKKKNFITEGLNNTHHQPDKLTRFCAVRSMRWGVDGGNTERKLERAPHVS